MQALLILGSNVAISAPHAGHIHTRLKDLEFLVVSDLFLSETAALADVVLPTTQWAEEESTMTNVEGRVLWRRRALAPPAGVLTDTEIVARLAQRLGFGPYFSPESRAIFDELRRASRGGIADYAGITYERIAAEDGIFWPCPHEEHPGTPRLFSERFHTEDGRACFHAVEYRPAAEEPDTEYPLYLTTGRVRAQYQSGTQTRRVEALSIAEPEPFVEIHPAMAQRFGIAEGDMVRLTTRRGSALVKSRLTPNIRMDTLFMPFHWGSQACANRLTNPALDPDSKIPEFKVCAARLELARRSDKATEGYVH